MILYVPSMEILAKKRMDLREIMGQCLAGFASIQKESQPASGCVQNLKHDPQATTFKVCKQSEVCCMPVT